MKYLLFNIPECGNHNELQDERSLVNEIPFAIGFVILQIIVLLINILFCLWRNGII